MFDIQIYCGCGYNIRFAGERFEDQLMKKSVHCPGCARDLLIHQGLLQTHPLIRNLVGRDANWENVTSADAGSPLEMN